MRGLLKAKSVFLLILSLSFAEDCFDEVQISVFDQRGRPIEGGDARLSCGYESLNISSISIYEKRYTKELEPTDSSGVARVSGKKMHCICGGSVKASASFRGINGSVDGIWHGGVNSFSIRLGDYYDLEVFVNNSNTGLLGGAEVIVSPVVSAGIPSLHAMTDDSGVALFRQIPSDTMLIAYARHGNRSISKELNISDSDESLHLILKNERKPSYPGVNASDRVEPSEEAPSNESLDKGEPGDSDKSETNKDSSLTWFHHLMDRTDGLEHGKNSQKFSIVFVPIGYSWRESQEFRQLALESVDRFAEVSPFRECESPPDKIEVFMMEPSMCNITTCSDICDSDGDAEDCQSLIKECSNRMEKYPHPDLTVGLCKDVACGGACGGCSSGIPSETVVVNSRVCGGATPDRIVTHEIGHALGLFHVLGPYGINGCWDDERGACQGPNAADCALPASERSGMIMAYCPSMEEYGPAGYAFLKEHALKEYVGACR